MDDILRRTSFVSVICLAISLTSCGRGEAPKPPPPTEGNLVTEAQFLFYANKEVSDEEVGNEWRAARADHRLIAHSVLVCKEKLDYLYAMPRNLFSALLLDLTPRGSHLFEAPQSSSIGTVGDGNTQKGTTVAEDARPPQESGATYRQSDQSANTPARPATERAIQHQQDESFLKSSEWDLLVLSNSVARAQLMAARERSGAQVPATKLWQLTLFVSAMATLFVTIQTWLRRPSATQDPDKIIPHQPTMLFVRSSTWFSGFYGSVALLALIFSIAGTSLNAAKQYFDPTRAVVQNERAIMSLRKLHQAIALAGKCDGKTLTYEEAKRSAWTTSLQTIIGEIITPYSPASTPDRNGS